MVSCNGSSCWMCGSYLVIERVVFSNWELMELVKGNIKNMINPNPLAFPRESLKNLARRDPVSVHSVEDIVSYFKQAH